MVYTQKIHQLLQTIEKGAEQEMALEDWDIYLTWRKLNKVKSDIELMRREIAL